MSNLKAVLQNLKSDKIKERQDGISAIRNVFEDDKVVANFHIDRDGNTEPRAWLSVFQALFQAVLSEKLAFTKKTTGKSAGSSATAQRRLSEAASAVRWLAERAARLMNKRVVRALFEHLLQTMIYKGELLTPVALDYIKALKCLVSYTPHLENMEDDTWIRMVELGFNTILGDPITTTFDQDDMDGLAPGIEADNSDLFMDDDSMDVDEDQYAAPSTSRKRGRSESGPTQRPPSSKASLDSRRNVSRQAIVSLEQVEFMSVLSLLLKSTSSPILSSHYPFLGWSILHRLQRFLDVYPADSSLVQDYVASVLSVLSHLSLNRIKDVTRFSRLSWGGLVGLWGTKNKNMKEGLVAILKVLFPFVTSDSDAQDKTPFNCVEGLGKLWYLLAGEAESRWGVDGLSLDSLRLELLSPQDKMFPGSSNTACVAGTFRSGWDFDPGQALAWAILELQADCAGKLSQLSESMHSSTTPGTARSEGKRFRLESPIAYLLSSIQHQSTTNIRIYHLQTLLFFIDRHWLTAHDSLQQEVIQVLLQSISHDDGVIQSWVLLCLAAVVHAENARLIPSSTRSSGYTYDHQSSTLGAHTTQDTAIWESIWTNSIRRANVPTVCRAACHTAHTLLVHAQPRVDGGRIALSSQRILSEIETLGKDLDVQGPAFPYDSVCAFLSQCLKVASQDMRLYRMQLEEKALSWLVDCWKVVGMRRKRMPLHMVKDLMLLLESICGLTKRSNLISRVPLPDCQIVKTLEEERKVKVIRDFLLDAQLPEFKQITDIERVKGGLSSRTEAKAEIDPDHFKNAVHLTQPRGRERKVSTFLLKSVEGLISEWEENAIQPTAETARQSLDMAVTALAFESVLILNGTQPNRRLLQYACKLIGITATLLIDTRWTVAEKAFISLGLDPLTSTGEDYDNRESWEAMPPPGIGTGIKTQILNISKPNAMHKDKLSDAQRINFLRILWQQADVQDAFNGISETIRLVLRATLGEESITTSNLQNSYRGNRDDFEPIRQVSDTKEQDSRSCCRILEVCIAFLVVGPALQSVSGEPTRDKNLTETILSCAESQPQMFFFAFPIFLKKVQQRTLHISVKSLDSFLTEVARLLQEYAYARSSHFQSLAIRFLESTVDIWASEQSAIGEVLDDIRELCSWLAAALNNQKIRAWSVRDSLALFLNAYLVKDPSQRAWLDESKKEEGDELLPSYLLPSMSSDEDVRVRFRVAVINTRLFGIAHILQADALEIYNQIQQQCSTDIDNYEHILTRMLTLGNIMIVSSAVRRGPYWHLLETCIYSPLYSRHIETILRGVSQRMGLSTFSVLFKSYASQLAYSILKADADFLRFPPHLLGYRDRKECAEFAFRSFTPTNIWNGGRKLFEGHCKIIQKSVNSGLRECFGNILAYKIVGWIDEHGSFSDEMEQLLRDGTFQGQEFEESLNRNTDRIVASILHTLSDQDFSDNGPIFNALHNADKTGRSAQIFRALSRYRRIEHFDFHEPNLPKFPTETILLALDWMRFRLSDTDAKATTYHVLHQLFADIEDSPLVNEQIRLINAMSLWVATHYQLFDDATLLHTLMHGATSLFAQSDLAPSSQSILEWAFDCYRRAKTKDSRFPDLLIRIACVAHDYSCNAIDPKAASMGNDLSQWIDTQVFKLSKVTELRNQVLRALSAWPYESSTNLANLYECVTAETLSTVLEDHRISSNKFRLVRRLHGHALSNDYSEEKFTKSDFWRLKECIPPMDRLQEADIHAFLALLFMNKGEMDSFSSERPNSASLLDKHRRNLQKQTSSGPHIDKAQEFIVLTLLEMLQRDIASQVYVAYQALRLIKSSSTGDIAQFNLWPTEHQVELQYLEAYRPFPKRRSPCNMMELLTSELYLDSTRDFPRWISSITILLSDVLSEKDSFYAQLSDILQSDVVFAEEILPILVHTLLQAEKDSMETISEATNTRFLLSKYFTSILSSNFAGILCLHSVIQVVLHLRYSPRSKDDAWSYNKWLDIDFTLLARNAITCGAYTTALLFLELAAENRVDGVTDNASEEQILYEIYRHIDEPDGFYGINDNNLHQFLMKRFHHEKQWEKAFRFHGAALEAGGAQVGDTEGLVQSFHSFGFDHLAIDALRNSSIANDNASSSPSATYRLGWRTETWDLPDCNENLPSVSLYLALRAIHGERDSHTIDNVIRTGLIKEIGRLQLLGPENFAEIREVVQALMCLREIVQWKSGPVQNFLASKHISFAQWHNFVEISPSFEFSNLENIMATRISLIRSARKKEERHQIGNFLTPFAQGLIDIEKRCLVRLSEAARNASQTQIALNSVVRAQLLERVPTFAVSQEFANVLWDQKEEQVAVQYLARLASEIPGGSQQLSKDTVNDSQKAVLLARLGTWFSEACLKKPTDIRDQYFEKAANLLGESNLPNENDSNGVVYHQCAIFAERQYQTIINSPDVIRWKVYVERKKQEIESRERELMRTPTEQLKRDQEKAIRLLNEDSESFRTHTIARNIFLRQAIDMYSRCLQTSSAFDVDAAIRLCSLWFANFEDDETMLQKQIGVALGRVPSHKFVFLAHQLSARISKPQAGLASNSQESLQNLIVRMCHDHPFHSLYQVHCLKPDNPVASGMRRNSQRHSPSSTQVDRSAAAGDIFSRLRVDPVSCERVRQVETLCSACMQWAKYPLKNGKFGNVHGKNLTIPHDMQILKIVNFRVPVITHHTPLDPTMRYDNCVWIEKYERTFETAGGINLPKITVCHDTSGQKYKQLFKGEGGDDLRQDAVMEQVFELVNSVLSQDRETRRRSLNIRGYNVIPLGAQAGVLEFVSNTTPMKNWLNRAHPKYYPDDISPQQATKKMEFVQTEYLKHRATKAAVIDTFRTVKNEFRPVMRHYFTERHKTPISWFAMRLKYTRSVATTSIVGHVLGLGDRHTSNILLDNITGEVIHIDLGIAFDQGKLLKVPELVPFRMTRDIVDGMGTTGTRGVFQRCAEETLRVLRQDSEVIMTVLEVFKHDPLHSWTANEVKVQRVQQDVSTDTSTTNPNPNRLNNKIGIDMSSGTAEEAADRALSSVARKLDKALSVQYTVNQLVTDATYEDNLALIYSGWGAHF